jgi:spermidine synthase
MILARTGEMQPIVSQPVKAPVPRSVRALVAALLFAIGFVALGTEVLWTRFLALLLDNTVYTYTITLALVLVGIVLGSGLVACLPDRTPPRARLFGGLQVANGLLVWGLLMLPASAWNLFGSAVAVASILLLPPALLAGAAFPLGVRMVITTPAWAGIGVGTMTAVNTLGGIAGALAVGFLLLPRFGLEVSARFCTALSLAAGFAAWAWLDRGGRRLTRLALAVAAVLAWLAIPRLTGTRLPADFLAGGGALVDYREGLESNVALVRRNPGVLALEIDRWWQGQDKKTHQVMAAHLPMLLHPDPRRVLVVGVGAGQTPMRVMLYDVERLDCVDIEPGVFDLIRAHFPSAWMNDPRVRLLREDGRNHLTHTAERYDVISLEVGQVFRPGVASFYTADFYRRARERLSPGGLLSQFVPLAFLSTDEVRAVIATFLDVFPQATLWYNTSELLLIGSPDAPLALRPERLAQLTSNAAIAEDLRFSLWGGPDHWLVRPEVLLGGFLCGPRALAALSAGAPVYRDDQPVLEYAASRARGGDMQELQTLPLIRSHLESIESVAPGVASDLARAAANVREKNLNDVVAAAHLRGVEAALQGGDHGNMVAELRLALAANPENFQANRLMGDALLRLGQVEESEPFYLQALAIWDGDARVHASLALAYLRQRRLAGAVEHYRAALAVGDDDAELRNSLGVALGLQGNLAGALEQFERALVLRPDFAEARGNLMQSRAALEAQQAAGAGR